eukprot:g1318.t1
MVENSYAGWEPQTGDRGVERLPAATVRDMTAEEFFRRFVAPRKPVLLEGTLPDGAWQAHRKWTNAYLAQRAGSALLQVETRADVHQRFGRGVEQPMRFAEFLRRQSARDALLYLSTQDLGEDDAGRHLVLAAPVAQLRDDFPLRPRLMGRLVPQSINLWMGASPPAASPSTSPRPAASSGLHHDFHDNLYVLLRGRKRFRLFSPACAPRMYVSGDLVRVHANGRINYDGALTRADGAEEGAVSALAAAQAQRRAEAELQAAEAALAAGENGATERLERAEQALDDALEVALEAEGDGGGDGEEEDQEEDEEDEEEEVDEHEEDESSKAEVAAADQRCGEDCEDRCKGGGDERPRKRARGTAPTATATAAPSPPNFSRVELGALLARQRGAAGVSAAAKGGAGTRAEAGPQDPQFPLFPAARMLEVEVRAGEMLFLPCGWFHEVSSFSDSGGRGGGSDVGTASSGDGGHCALNYWFHPPDKTTDWRQPYSSPFWEMDWADRGGEEGVRKACSGL